MKNEKAHDGYKVKRIREILGIKQEKVALELGGNWNQQRISILEQKQTISNDLLDRIAEILKVPVNTIRSFSDDAVVKIVAELGSEKSVEISTNQVSGIVPPFNPIGKMIELYERIIKEIIIEIDSLKMATQSRL